MKQEAAKRTIFLYISEELYVKLIDAQSAEVKEGKKRPPITELVRRAIDKAY